MTNDQIAVALFVAVLSAVVTAWLRPVVQRRLQQQNEKEYLIQELIDIKRHLRENAKVLENIVAYGDFPAPMHINKLKIPETSAIFSIETLKLSKFKFSSRLYEIRLKLRNLNLEVDDCILYCSEEYKYQDFAKFISYHLEKINLVSDILETEIRILQIGWGGKRQRSATLPKVVPLPRKIKLSGGGSRQKTMEKPAGPSESEQDDSASPAARLDNEGQSAETSAKQ